MATSNRVFVSPGVYTSELDLTFVAQSVGVTTLGLIGETLKGPAFEPVLISSFDEFKTYFGSTSPEKDANGNPKYELGYVAKAYLQESNQLFVTRVLGLTGYLPVNTFGIKTLGGITVNKNASTITTPPGVIPVTGASSSQFYTELLDKVTVDGTTFWNWVNANYSTFNNGDWFTIGFVLDTDIAWFVGNAGNRLDSPFGNNNNKDWYNVFFDNASNPTKVYSYTFEWYDNPSTGGDFYLERYEFSATLNTDYDGVVVAAFRPRGHYSRQTLNLEVTSNSNFTLSSSEITTNPLGLFTLDVYGLTSQTWKSFECSMDVSSPKYITKVLGESVYDKSYEDYPIYVHETYPHLLKNLYDQGLIRGLSTSKVREVENENFMVQWDTAKSPTVVSEVRGGKVADLFKIITISDGSASNVQVKIMIQNINVDTAEFDLIVRDFNDTDDNVVALERYTRCSMDPDMPGYIAKKIGTSDGEYTLNSKYIMLYMEDNAPTDAFPSGFKGFVNNSSFGSGNMLGSVLYKTKYLDSGEIINYDADGTPNTSNGDKPRKVSLGLSSQSGFRFDRDLFMFKGLGATTETFGFHLSTNASTIQDNSGNYIFKTTEYDFEGSDKGKLDNIQYRKFTFATCGGFDGWDIYRNVRTNSDAFIYGKKPYISGNTANGGVFNEDFGNSDYYSYLQGIQTFSNPEAVDINVFATPGLNFYDHSSLTTQAIDMIENDRADSLYITASPNRETVDEVVGDIDTVGFDSNYSATYWPWIQIRDVDNATQLYIPPTGEVCRNIALTDNVSYPWFAVAGYSRGLVNSIKARKKLTLDERDVLYKNRINPIATFSDTGTIIWGNKTLQVRESALDRINVRRLLLRARKLISAVSVRLLFEQNDDQVRNEFLRLVNPILEAIKKERGLYEFRVTVSNAPEDLDANTLRGKIYIKPTRSLEFIDLEFIITPTGASFENI